MWLKYSKCIPQQAEVAQGVPGSLRPWIFLTFGTTRVVGRQPYATGCLYPRRNPWYSLSEAELTSGHTVLSGGTTEKIPSDTTGNRYRDCALMWLYWLNIYKYTLLSSIICKPLSSCMKKTYEGWNFNSGNYLFTTDTKYIHVSKFYCPSM